MSLLANIDALGLAVLASGFNKIDFFSVSSFAVIVVAKRFGCYKIEVNPSDKVYYPFLGESIETIGAGC